MTRNILFIFLSNILVWMFYSCAPSTTVTELFLQNVEVSGPINSSPIHISDGTESAITISSRFSYNPKNNLTGKTGEHTLVNQQGVFQFDTVFNSNGTFYFRETPGANRYSYEANNLSWNLADVSLSLDFDLKTSRSFALFFGGNYSAIKQKSMWGGLVGIGLMSNSSNSALRFDIGLNIQEIPYNAYTIVSVTRTDNSGTINYITDYNDISKKTMFNPFAALTINTSNPDWLFNIFLFAKYGTQSLINFSPENEVYHNPFYYGDVYVTEDNRGEATAGIIDLTPGLYFKFGETGRILIGAKMNWIVQISDIDNSFFMMPVVQFDFKL